MSDYLSRSLSSILINVIVLLEGINWKFFSVDFKGTKILFHYGQWILSGKFAFYDYLNIKRNMIAYGLQSAPDYPIWDIRSRNIVLVLGKTNIVVNTKDLNKLITKLQGKL